MRARSGYTLVEILITLAVIAVLLAMLLPAVARGLASARAFRCETSLRSVAFDFTVFADEGLHPWRGDDEGKGKQFSLETYVESQYAVSEFWAYGKEQSVTREAGSGVDDPMRCAEVKGAIKLSRNLPCSSGAVGPPRNISYGFNMRLWRIDPPGASRVKQVMLDSSVLRAGRVPLAWDVDGEAATANNPQANPTFTCPPLAGGGPYADGSLWWPAMRHKSAINVAFVDGSVGSSRSPLAESEWRWAYRAGDRVK